VRTFSGNTAPPPLCLTERLETQREEDKSRAARVGEKRPGGLGNGRRRRRGKRRKSDESMTV
ncbi:hypothetical protein XENORESO_005279, partial [Xenotaenia resolanae]